ncbi:hypothetical protein Pla110_11520 [Polystyrenella longa]|uniref:Uncharacterized protein n=1 Tax=Polystyrenella longa TaxID=2528007 RepID=A0A518CJN9_9PLAN|nr:hypothetical protein [Polystyrenella longa]QDU79442.1 hypothetical protein Pla110_11520 [Polystyrenella longa]
METPTEFENLDTVRDWIHETLCQRENLLLDQFPTTETPLIKKGKLCGLQYTLHGPRNVRLSAIWATDHNIIYFYDAQGERYHKQPLANRVELSDLYTCSEKASA